MLELSHLSIRKRGTCFIPDAVETEATMTRTNSTEPPGTSKRIAARLTEVAERVEQRLITFFDEVERTPPSAVFNTRPSAVLLSQVRDLTLRAGKRLRAALIIAGASLFDPRAAEQDAVIDVAAAMELRQSYLLIHDDIMDGDTMRRGGPAVSPVCVAGTCTSSGGR